MTRLWPLLAQTLSESRLALAAWTAALVGVTGLYTGFYPQFRDNPELARAFAAVPDWVRDTFNMHDLTGAGWLGGTVYGGVVPLVTMAFAITFAGRILSGDEERVPATHLAAVTLNLTVLGWIFGALTAALAGAMGRRAVVSATAAALGALAYIVDGLGKHFPGLHALRRLSPFRYYLGNEPLRQGLTWSDPAVLLGASAALLVVGLWAFARRDVGV